MDFLINAISEIPSKILGFFSRIIEMIVMVLDALLTFYEMLLGFDAMIVEMVDSCSFSNYSGMPVVEAISTFRYLVGDVAFYMIYLTVLFGCLMTIYKLVVLLYDAIDALMLQVTGANCKSLFSNLLSKIFK